MSAINAFFTPDDMFAYLATDGAAFSYADGSVAALGTKVSAFPEYRIAFSVAGPNVAGAIVGNVINGLVYDQASALEHMRQAVIECRKGMRQGKPEGEQSGVNELTMVAVVFLEIENRPAIFRMDTRPASITGLAPNRWHEIEGIIIPSKVPAYIADRGYWIDDAFADSRALFRAQRHFGFEGLHGAPGVGGTCQLYRVGPDGIRAWDILDFGEQIGDRASVINQGVDVLRPIQTMNFS